jgi:hypothetical protein
MDVDTGQFLAIKDLAEKRTDALADIVLRISSRLFKAGYEAGQLMAAADQPAAAGQAIAAAGRASAPRHAKSRRDRHGLRLVAGGGAR